MISAINNIKESNELLGLAAKTLMSGTVLMVAPSPKIVILKISDSETSADISRGCTHKKRS
jgi:hypothetical protein